MSGVRATAMGIAGAAGAALVAYAWRQGWLSQVARRFSSSELLGPPKRVHLPFDQVLFSGYLTTERLGRQFRYWEEVGSTMTEAKAEVAAPARGETGAAGREALHGTVYLAEGQTGGIGRRQRDWQSPKGNLYFSFVWAPAPPYLEGTVLSEMQKLNLAASVAVAQAARSAKVEALVKWPNDVWVGDRKFCGILVDFLGDNASVVGIGVNCNSDMISQESLKATSLHDELGAPVVREKVLADVCANLEALMRTPYQEIMEEYQKFDLLTGKMIRVHHGTRGTSTPRDFDAEVLGYDATGALRVRHLVTNAEHVLLGEEVSIRPAST